MFSPNSLSGRTEVRVSPDEAARQLLLVEGRHGALHVAIALMNQLVGDEDAAHELTHLALVAQCRKTEAAADRAQSAERRVLSLSILLAFETFALAVVGLLAGR